MSEQSSGMFFEDQFTRADSTDLANNWTLGSGDLQIINGAVQQSSSSAATTELYQAATTAAASLGPDYAVSARVSCDDASTARAGYIHLRKDGTDGYLVGLHWDETGAAQVLTLNILKSVAGSRTTLATLDVTAEMNAVSDNFDDVIQLVGANIYDDSDGVVIDAFFNDEERVRLTATDNVYPNFKQAGSFGFEFQDADAGVAGHVMLHGIRILGLIDRNEEYDVIPAQYTAGKLRDSLREKCLRDSDSRLQPQYFMDLINEASQELHADIVRAPWLTELYEFQMAANADTHELPADTASIGSEVWAVTNQLALPVLNLQQFRALGRSTSAGTPDVFYLAGYGPRNGMLLRCYSKTNVAINYSVPRFKTPRILVNDSDIPELPQELCPGLIWIALHYYTMRDSDRSHMNMAAMKAEQWKQRIQRYINKHETLSARPVVKHGFHRGNHIKSVLETARYGVRR